MKMPDLRMFWIDLGDTIGNIVGAALVIPFWVLVVSAVAYGSLTVLGFSPRFF